QGKAIAFLSVLLFVGGVLLTFVDRVRRPVFSFARWVVSPLWGLLDPFQEMVPTPVDDAPELAGGDVPLQEPLTLRERCEAFAIEMQQTIAQRDRLPVAI